jgi:hypothetical protein
LIDERKDWIADYLGLVSETVEIDFAARGGGGYEGPDVRGYYAALGLSSCECCFGVDAAVYVCCVVEDLGLVCWQIFLEILRRL